MSYATSADMIERFGTREMTQLTDRETPKTGSPVTSVIDTALSDSIAEMNPYLAKQYSLPIAAPNATLANIQMDLARFKLHENKATEEVLYRYEERMKQLRNLASGLAVLTDDNGTAIEDGDDGGIQTPEFETADTVFTDELLGRY